MLSRNLSTHPLLVLRALRAIVRNQTRLGDTFVAWTGAPETRQLFVAYGRAAKGLSLAPGAPWSADDDRALAAWVKTEWPPVRETP